MLNTVVLLCFTYSFICKPFHSNSDENEKLIFITSVVFGHKATKRYVELPQLETEPVLSAMEAQGLNHWTTRGVPFTSPD